MSYQIFKSYFILTIVKMTNTSIITTLFAQNSVVVLRNEHFTISGTIDINNTKISCILVLFYSKNDESKKLIKIWGATATQTPGIVFAAVDLSVHKDIANNHWTNPEKVPFILTYQSGVPINIYRGEKSIEAIAEFSLTLSCLTKCNVPLQMDF